MILTLKRWFGLIPPDVIELKLGCVYVIEATAPMTGNTFSELSDYLKEFTERTECEFLVLDHGFKIAVRK